MFIKKNRGFTLIELMIVIAIIGTLVAVAMPKFANMIQRAKEAATKGSLGALRSVISIYYADTYGDFPHQLTVKITIVADAYLDDDGGSNTPHPDLVPRYITRIPDNFAVGHESQRNRVWNASAGFDFWQGSWDDPPGSGDGGWIYIQDNSFEGSNFMFVPGDVRIAYPNAPDDTDTKGDFYYEW